MRYFGLIYCIWKRFILCVVDQCGYVAFSTSTFIASFSFFSLVSSSPFFFWLPSSLPFAAAATAFIRVPTPWCDYYFRLLDEWDTRDDKYICEFMRCKSRICRILDDMVRETAKSHTREWARQHSQHPPPNKITKSIKSVCVRGYIIYIRHKWEQTDGSAKVGTSKKKSCAVSRKYAIEAKEWLTAKWSQLKGTYGLQTTVIKRRWTYI